MLSKTAVSTYLWILLRNDSFFFATGNCDFREDTLSGKDTSHVIAVSSYQRKEFDDVCCSDIKNPIPGYIIEDVLLFICKEIIRNPLDTQLGLLTVEDILEFSGIDATNEINILVEERPCKIPPWAAFNSLTPLIMPTTRIATLPLINDQRTNLTRYSLF